MGLWWLAPEWKQAICPHCGNNIWDTGGDPDWGECYDCRMERHLSEETYGGEYVVPPCDMCNENPSVATVDGYNVCSEQCSDKAAKLAKEKKDENISNRIP